MIFLSYVAASIHNKSIKRFLSYIAFFYYTKKNLFFWPTFGRVYGLTFSHVVKMQISLSFNPIQLGTSSLEVNYAFDRWLKLDWLFCTLMEKRNMIQLVPEKYVLISTSELAKMFSACQEKESWARNLNSPLKLCW